MSRRHSIIFFALCPVQPSTVKGSGERIAMSFFRSLLLSLIPFLGCSFYSFDASAQPSCKTTLECAQAAVTAAAQAQAQVKALSDKLAKLQQVYVSGPQDVSCGAMKNPKPAPYTDTNGYGDNENTCYVAFPQAFQNPTVSLTMIGFNIGHSSNIPQNVVNLSITNVSNNGFNVQVGSNLDEVIYSVRLAYIVFFQL